MNSLSWQIGNVKVTSFVEIKAGDVIQQGFPELDPAIVRAVHWLHPNFADAEGNLKAVVQSFVVESEGKRILIDTCNGNDKQRTDLPQWGNLKTDFLTRFENAGFPRDTIDIVLSTHLHCDHVGWNTMLERGLWKPTFPNARYLFVQDEYEYFSTLPSTEIDDDRSAFTDSVLPIVEAGLADFVSPDHSLTNEVSLLSTPGHTPGHVSVCIRSEGYDAVITGDVMHHPCQLAHPEWKVLWDSDKEAGKATRHRFFERYADTMTLIIGSHFSSPTAGYIVRDAGGYRFITTLS